VCYQIVALGQPDIVYAVPIMEAIRDADDAFVITLPVCTFLQRVRLLIGGLPGPHADINVARRATMTTTSTCHWWDGCKRDIGRKLFCTRSMDIGTIRRVLDSSWRMEEQIVPFDKLSGACI
jgi:hypothetical protein